jgi:hypothetical protein
MLVALRKETHPSMGNEVRTREGSKKAATTDKRVIILRQETDDEAEKVADEIEVRWLLIYSLNNNQLVWEFCNNLTWLGTP